MPSSLSPMECPEREGHLPSFQWLIGDRERGLPSSQRHVGRREDGLPCFRQLLGNREDGVPFSDKVSEGGKTAFPLPNAPLGRGKTPSPPSKEPSEEGKAAFPPLARRWKLIPFKWKLRRLVRALVSLVGLFPRSGWMPSHEDAHEVPVDSPTRRRLEPLAGAWLRASSPSTVCSEIPKIPVDPPRKPKRF